MPDTPVPIIPMPMRVPVVPRVPILSPALAPIPNPHPHRVLTKMSTLTDEFRQVIETLLIPLAAEASSAATAAILPTAAFHAHYSRRKPVQHASFIVETTPNSVRIRGSRGLNNIGASWSSSRRVYVGGIKTDDPAGPFPHSTVAIPMFRSLLETMSIRTLGLFDQASVECPCGVAIPNISVVRVIAGEPMLYESIPGLLFKNADGARKAKEVLISTAGESGKAACIAFMGAHRSGLRGQCLHSPVNAAVTKGMAVLRQAGLINALFEFIGYIV